ncbi:DUF433 domain-containing protein [Pseudonocardia hispaniensis]|uniref:DUF433 domain-containing protein n=1 Tax=Pseudonocardia hispaniensis TaxID=904933 RepID=A0ABW1J8Q3_9PSEU
MPETCGRDLVGTVRVHPDDDPTGLDARRIIRLDWIDGWTWITGRPDHSGLYLRDAEVQAWRVQSLPALARILGHPDPADPGTDELLIVTHPARRGGRPTIGHTRLDVATIWEWLAAGETVEQICAAYPHVTAGQVRVVEALRADLTDHDTDDDTDEETR